MAARPAGSPGSKHRSHSHKQAPRRRAAPTLEAPKALQDGQAEVCLLKVYQLAGEGAAARHWPKPVRTRIPQLPAREEARVTCWPHACAPSSSWAMCPEPTLPYPPEVTATLDELRTESRQRVQAQRAHALLSTHIPAQFAERHRATNTPLPSTPRARGCTCLSRTRTKA